MGIRNNKTKTNDLLPIIIEIIDNIYIHANFKILTKGTKIISKASKTVNHCHQ